MVKGLQKEGVSERRSCELLGMARSSMRYNERPKVEDQTREEIRLLAKQYKGYGSPKLCGLIRRNRVVNHKKVERIYGEENLQLPRRAKRKRRLGPIDQRPYPAMAPNDVWSCDFVFDRDVMNRKLKFLTVVPVCRQAEMNTRGNRRRSGLGPELGEVMSVPRCRRQ